MTAADDLEAARASLVMINPAPYNAEAPPAALVGDITPTDSTTCGATSRCLRTTGPWRSAVRWAHRPS